jgi:glycosyltransferase involved in cell wall biosynthesis
MKMKILYIHVLYDPFIVGGAEITLQKLAEGMLKKGHEVSVISFHDKNKVSVEKVNGVEVIRAPIKNLYLPYFVGKERPNAIKRSFWHIFDIYNFGSKNMLENLLKDLKPDVVSLHNLPGWSISVWDVLYKHKIPCVQVLHDQYLICPRSMFKKNAVCKKRCLKCEALRYIHKKKSNKLTAVVGVSKFILNKFLDFGYFKDNPIKRTIHNVRNYDLHKVYNYRKLTDEDMVFGFIGAIAQHKGIEKLLAVFSNIEKDNWRLIIAGSGESSYFNYLSEKYTHPRISFLGRVKPEEFYPNVDVTIVPSIWEDTFPGVVFESFIFGKPVIGSNRGGIPEMIQEGVNGEIFDVDSDGDLANRMVRFAEKISFWRNKYDIIQKSAEKFNNYSAWIENYEKLYIEVIEYEKWR